MRDVLILSGVRTPFGRGVKGVLKDTRPDDLGIEVVREALRRAGVDATSIEDVVLGCAMPEGEQGMNVARIVALGAGLPVETPAMTVNRFCSSGVQSIAIVAHRIMTGQIECGVAGGVESMSMIPMTGTKLSLNPRIVDERPEIYTPMGVTAENVARRFEISRQAQDEFALRSQQRTIAAQRAGRFAEEILPLDVTVFDDSGRTVRLRMKDDECPRGDTELSKLAALKPAFDPTGSVTAGNSSPLTDGAAAVVLASSQAAPAKTKPLGYFRAFAVAGVPPEIMGIGPVPAIRKLLKKTGLTMEQIDLFEINEAFASQALYCSRELGVPDDRLNVNGGAIAIGHPLGVTGTRLVITILSELARRGGRYGVVSMCIGGGMGAAALVERA